MEPFYQREELGIGVGELHVVCIRGEEREVAGENMDEEGTERGTLEHNDGI